MVEYFLETMKLSPHRRPEEEDEVLTLKNIAGQCITVGPHLKDTLDKGQNTFNLFIQDIIVNHGKTILSLKEDNLCITIKLYKN